LKVGKKLFYEFYRRVKEKGATKIVLETECVNSAALKFYQSLGFFKTRRMLNYYMSGNDAFRLKLYIPENEKIESKESKSFVKIEDKKI
jgi:peptide alpha-N-acetyltransferase